MLPQQFSNWKRLLCGPETSLEFILLCISIKHVFRCLVFVQKFIKVFVGVFIYVEFVRTCCVFTHLLFTPTYRNEAFQVPDFYLVCLREVNFMLFILVFCIFKRNRKRWGVNSIRTPFEIYSQYGCMCWRHDIRT